MGVEGVGTHEHTETQIDNSWAMMGMGKQIDIAFDDKKRVTTKTE